MKAARFAVYGEPDVLQVVDVPEPHAGRGQVRIAVRAAGVNGLDWKIRHGLLRQTMPLELPAGTGTDASGVVDETGEDVTGVHIGDPVFGSGTDTYAEYAVLAAWARIPGNISFAEAAGYPTPVQTAVRVLDQIGVQRGRTLLVSGAAGGVGSATVQLACDRGIKVIGTASPANQAYLASLGATATTYGGGLADRVRALAPHGIDAALDIAGSGIIPELIELTGDPATVLSIADFTASDHGVRISAGYTGDNSPALRQGAQLAQAGHFTIPVAQTFPLDQAGAAQAASATGHVRGRFIITTTGPSASR